MSAESKYKEIADQFAVDMVSAMNDAMAKVHGDITPYINDDTENNATYRAADIVRSIIQGRFSVDGGCIAVDGWTILRLTSADYDAAVDAIASKAGDVALKLKIERLERQLADSYRAF